MKSINREKKYLLLVVVLALFIMISLVFSSASIIASAEETTKIEVYGTIYHQSSAGDKPPYSGESQSLENKFLAKFKISESESAQLEEGKDFVFKEDTHWRFKAPGEEVFTDLDANNNFVLAGIYTREVTIKGDTCVQKEGETTTFEYEIKPVKPKDLLRNKVDNTLRVFKAVIGITKADIVFPMGWSIAATETKLDGDATKGGIFTTNETTAEPEVIQNVNLVFNVPEGINEANFDIPAEEPDRGAAMKATVSVSIAKKPTIIFKEGTQQITVQAGDIAYDAENNKFTGNVISRPSNFTKAGYNFSHFPVDGYVKNVEGEDVPIKFSNESNKPEDAEKTFSLNPAVEITFKSNWTPRNDTKYKVKYYRQTIKDETKYDPPGVKQVETYQGTTDTFVEIKINEEDAKIITIKGFTFDPIKTKAVDKYSGTVVADSANQLVLELYYTRNKYTLKYVLAEDETGVTGEAPADSLDNKFDVSVHLADGGSLNKLGYKLVGWKDGTKVDGKDSVFAPGSIYTVIDPENEEKIITLTAVFEPRKDTKYKVIHYTADGTEIQTDNLEGETDLEITAVASIPGHTAIEHADSKATGTITADGNLVLKLYYEKIDYSVTFTYGSTPVLEARTYNINDKFTLPAGPAKEGYTFKGWVINGRNFNAGEEIEVNGPMRIEATYLSANAIETPDTTMNTLM